MNNVSKYFKPYLDLLCPSTQQMRKMGLIKNYVRPSQDNPTDDNGPVAFGQVFKRFLK